MILASLLCLSIGRISPPTRRHALTGLGADGRRVTLTFAANAVRTPLFGKVFQ
jgi:hypothetical protein